MTRNFLAATVCLVSVSVPAFASGPQDLAGLLRRYDASEVAKGAIQVSTSGDLTYVSGTSQRGPWLEVWRRTDGIWKMVAGAGVNEVTPLRFGTKRDRSRRCTS
jgi:hypothetical protein